MTLYDYFRIFVALWACSGLLTFHVVWSAPGPRDADPPELDLARWAMFFWVALLVILLGPVGLFYALDFREERRAQLKRGAP